MAMRRYLLLALAALAACAPVRRVSWDAPLRPQLPAPARKRDLPPEKVLPTVDARAGSHAALGISISLPKGRKLYGPIRARITETGGPIVFLAEHRKFALKEPRSRFTMPFRIRGEGRCDLRLVVEFYHCRAKPQPECVEDSAYFLVTMEARKGKGLSTVPVPIAVKD